MTIKILLVQIIIIIFTLLPRECKMHKNRSEVGIIAFKHDDDLN
jgi:hypothetical protein